MNSPHLNGGCLPLKQKELYQPFITKDFRLYMEADGEEAGEIGQVFDEDSQ